MANVFKPGFVNPINTKGDLIGGASGGISDRLPVGTDGFVLTASAAATLGFSWSAAAAGNVITNFTSLRVEFASIASDGTIDAASGSFLASVTRVNNSYVLNFGASMFSSAPVCTVHPINNNLSSYRGASGPTSTGYVIDFAVPGTGVGATTSFNVIVVGKP